MSLALVVRNLLVVLLTECVSWWCNSRLVNRILALRDLKLHFTRRKRALWCFMIFKILFCKSWKIRELDGAPEGTPCLHRPFCSLHLFAHCLLYGRCIKFYDFYQADGVNFLNGCQLDNSRQYVRFFSIASNLWDHGTVSRSIASLNLRWIIWLVGL